MKKNVKLPSFPAVVRKRRWPGEQRILKQLLPGAIILAIPSSTYRIQFREGMTFDRVAEIVPYLAKLGVSHLYASPIFTAVNGSTHGYDIVDSNEIDPSLGGRAGFEALVDRLHHAGLGLILDIVPNHMAASLQNRWWYDVVMKGNQSKYAQHFDIDWSKKLTLPVLNSDLHLEIEGGEISLHRDPQSGCLALSYNGAFYPIYPGSENNLGLEQHPNEPSGIAALLERQTYRLIPWRNASSELSYRRFFEVTGLVGLRVEDEVVFQETHRLVRELAKNKRIDGIRVDHVDGLADPKGYLKRLRATVGGDCYIAVEKILGENECLPRDWPVAGSTGYEFIEALSHAFIDGEKLGDMRRAYEVIAGSTVNASSELRRAKLLMVDKNFAGEVSSLETLAALIISGEKDAGSISRAAINFALRELLVMFPVYRTYATATDFPASNKCLIDRVFDELCRNNSADRNALSALKRILVIDVNPAHRAAAISFLTKFQQLTGPLTAKATEDTLFYRDNAFLAINEVGAHALNNEYALTRFHAAMIERAQSSPLGLSATSTHDTKRGEDARARLYALSEAPEIWAAAVTRWREMNAQGVVKLDEGLTPGPGTEWMIYQALAGFWPADTSALSGSRLEQLEERFVLYLTKALREAKERTNWGEENEVYENSVASYARRLFASDNKRFRYDFSTTLKPFIQAGFWNTISQTIIKLTAPGIPDVYQGSEDMNFSLVDPDNRRAPDFIELQNSFSRNERSTFLLSGLSGRDKQWVTHQLLRARQTDIELFHRGSYSPLHVTGPLSRHVIPFTRVQNDRAVIVVVPRLQYTLVSNEHPITPSLFNGTEITLPSGMAGLRMRNVFTGRRVVVGKTINLGELLETHPFLVLHTTDRNGSDL